MATEATGDTLAPRREEPLPQDVSFAQCSRRSDLRKAIVAAVLVSISSCGWDLFELAVPGTRGISLHCRLRPRLRQPVEAEEHAEWGGGFEQPRGGLPNRSARRRAPIPPFEPGKGILATIRALIAVLWAITVWGVTGGAIVRMAVVERSGRAGPGIIGSIRFALHLPFPTSRPSAPSCVAAPSAPPRWESLDWLPDPVGHSWGEFSSSFPVSCHSASCSWAWGQAGRSCTRQSWRMSRTCSIP